MVTANHRATLVDSVLPAPEAGGTDNLHRERAMPKAYWISAYRQINDAEKLAAYAKLALPAIEAGGGRFLARATAAKAYEDGKAERTVLIEFESVAQAVATHDSAAYQQALAVLGNGAVRDMRVVAGV